MGTGIRTGLALLFLAASSAMAAGPAIGMAVSNGTLRVDDARIWGNTTLFDGNTIETSRAASDVKLSSGVQMRLASESRARVYQGRMILEKGYGQVASSVGFEVEARTLKIVPAVPNTVARIRLDGDKTVMVAAVSGALRVMNADGVLVANVEAGRAINFEPQSGDSAAPTKVCGCLLQKGGKPVIVDQTTNVILNLEGTGLERERGNRVEIVGKTSGPQSIQVTGMKRVHKGGCADVAKKIGAAGAGAAVAGAGAAGGAASAAGAGAAGGAVAGAAGAAGAAAAAGIGVGTVAVIGGVAAAATVGGLAAAGSLPGQGEQPDGASR